MKTRPYDPDLDGDGLSRMVSMEVEPPFPDMPCDVGGIVYWHNRVATYQYKNADGWTFAPKLPVPRPSWEEHLNREGRFNMGFLRGGSGTTRSRIRKDKERALALADLIHDELGLVVVDIDFNEAPKPPVKPEPVKSYAEYLDGDDFYFSRSTGCVHGVISAGSPAPWVLALRDFLNDYYPAQDALDGEGG